MSKNGRALLGMPAVRMTAYGLALIVLGLLLWARFIIVTGHPRTAIADPPEVRTTQAESPVDGDHR